MRRVRGTIGFVLGAAGLVAAELGTAGLVAGCSSASADGTGTNCGSTRTAVGVPVIIKVVKGNVGCADALAVENSYAAMIRSGEVRGNGGGAPVTVNGWTCQGYPTPKVLQTGDASQCHNSGAEILAVLPAPSGTPTAVMSS